MFYIKEGASSPSGLQQQLLHHCELRLKRSLDYEAVKNYGIVVRLKTADKGAVEPDKSVTRVDLTVLDVNDNSPRFVFKYPDSKWANGFVIISYPSFKFHFKFLLFLYIQKILRSSIGRCTNFICSDQCICRGRRQRPARSGRLRSDGGDQCSQIL